MNAPNIYGIAWKVLPKLPQRLVIAVSHAAADIVYALGLRPVHQMKRNFEQLTGAPASNALVRDGVRSYFRCFAQQFTLSGWSTKEIGQGCVYPGAQKTRELMNDGPVVLALTHSGNWDLAGAWFCQEWGAILTVAERLEPEETFNQFVEFREGIGMEIIGVGKGEHIFNELVNRAKGRSLLVPLLADRDISGTGIEVELGASKALVAAGPAALALKLGRPLIAGHISYRKMKGRWQIYAHFTEPIPVPDPKEGETEVEALTRAWVEAISPVMAQHVVDWHMMQKLFVADLDPERLARARNRVKRGPVD